ncbi:MAG: right-handed parallel beta-helix repeat-containing protein [FCB group bacterium]|jgi:hypothetical protein|nr:right-handed parallel beta-helix repeat-containing protein [FCB group bacterium]
MFRFVVVGAMLLLLAGVAFSQDGVALAREAFERGEFAQVLGMDMIPAHYKSLAQLRVGMNFEREGKIEEARQAYRAVAAIPEAPPHHLWEAEGALKAIERKAAGLPERDASESRVKLPAAPEPGLTWYVALDGNDSNGGTKEAPFGTLEKAVDSLRALKAGVGLPAGGVRICLREGLYRLKKGFSLDAGVSGTEAAPVVISACDGETVRLSGGAAVTGFKKVEDEAILARLPEEARGAVLVADLKAQGIERFAPLTFRGFTCGSRPSVELFFNGDAMTPARWPNEGFVRTGKVLDAGSLKENRGGVFEYEGDRPLRWQQAKDAWLYGYWFYDWADNSIAVSSLDVASRQIRTAQVSTYGLKEGQPYYAFNLLEEIDAPGEWYLDREKALLYFYPPSDPAAATVEISLLEEPVFRLEGVSFLTLEGLTVELSAGDGIVGTDCNRCLVAGCVIRRLGSNGVSFTGGSDCGVLSCDIYSLGRRGTEIIGGDRKTLTPARHFVENCDIHNFSRIDRTYTPAVQIEGVGNRIAHNHFHYSPCHAIRLEGNDHVVEFNNIHDVVKESDDQGGIDIFYNPSYRGNVLRFNYWHNIASGRACGQAGIRLDDAISGTAIYGNVFYRCSESQFGGVQIHGGKDNWVDNNVFVDCKYAISFSPWGAERWAKFLASDAVVGFLTRDVDIASPPYSTRYPALARLKDGHDVNIITRNIAYGCGSFFARDPGIEDAFANWVGGEDPGFVDAVDRNFTLKEDAAVIGGIGFRAIPFGEIGTYEDSLRISLK